MIIFGITNIAIKDLIRNAEKKAKSNKVLNNIEEKLGRKKKRKISIGAEIVHWLVYWPKFLVYFVFEIFKAVFTELHKSVIPIFAVTFFIAKRYLPNFTGMDNILSLRKILFKTEWYAFVHKCLGESINNGLEAIILSLLVILSMLVVYVLPPLLISLFVSRTVDDLNMRYDWIGYERTFQNIFQSLRKKTEDQYATHNKLYYKNKVPKVIINIVFVVLLILIVHFTPIGFKAFGEKTGCFQKDEIAKQYKSEPVLENEDAGEGTKK